MCGGVSGYVVCVHKPRRDITIRFVQTISLKKFRNPVNVVTNLEGNSGIHFAVVSVKCGKVTLHVAFDTNISAFDVAVVIFSTCGIPFHLLFVDHTNWIGLKKLISRFLSFLMRFVILFSNR